MYRKIRKENGSAAARLARMIHKKGEDIYSAKGNEIMKKYFSKGSAERYHEESAML